MKLGRFEQTVFISHEGLNPVRITVSDWDHCNDWKISVKAEGSVLVPERAVAYTDTVLLMLPRVQKNTELEIILTAFQELPLKFKAVLRPVKNWRISILHSSHEDVGYCGYANKLGKDCTDYLIEAMNLMDKWPDYHYMIEHYWWLKKFETYATPDQKEKLRKYFASGNVELNAPHSGNHTVWHGPELLARSMYYARHDAKNEWGINPHMALFTDVSGITWSAVSAYAGSGIKYAAVCRNSGFRMRNDFKPLPPLFKWMSPNGKDSLLCFNQDSYCFSLPVPTAADTVIDDTLIKTVERSVTEKIAAAGDTPSDCLPICNYCDREYPRDNMLRVAQALNAKWAWPRFTVDAPEQFMSYIEKNFADKLPVLSGQWPDQWSDFAIAAPEWTAVKREAQSLLTPAEALATIASVRNGKPYPKAEIDEALWRMYEFDEHCWATSSKHPLSMHTFNMRLVKRESANVAFRNLNGIIGNELGAPGEMASVWNLTPHKKKGSAILKGSAAPESGLSQLLPDGNTLVKDLHLPAFGCVPMKLNGKSERGAKWDSDCFETDFYTVKCDFDAHRIVSIVDKKSGEELLDECDEYALGDMIYINDQSGSMGSNLPDLHHLSFEYPKRRTFGIERGPLATIVTKRSYEEQLGANIVCRIMFYEDKPDIDLTVSFENASGLMGDYYDRYKKTLLIALPLRMPDHRFYTELAGGIVDESSDRMPVNPHDFVVANDYITVENGSRGIAVFVREMPVFLPGGIHYNELSTDVKYESSRLFLEAVSNRTNQLTLTNPSDCKGMYHISLLPFTGDRGDSVCAWSEEKRYPPVLGGEAEPASFMEIDAPNVRLLAFKKAEDEDAVIMRLQETAGRACNVRVRLPFTAAEAEYTNIVEEPTGEKAVFDGDALTVTIDAFSYATIRLTGIGVFTVKERFIEPVRNVFWDECEHSFTQICFEKNGCENVQSFEIYEGDTLIATVPNDEYKVQYNEIEGTGYRCLTVKPVC